MKNATSTKAPLGFTPLAGGWFLEEPNPAYESCWEATVADSLSEVPDVFYGPQKWESLRAPACAKVLLMIVMEKFEDWKKAVALAQKNEGVDPGKACPWPGVISVTQAGKNAGLADFEGKVVSSPTELIELLKPIYEQLPKREPQMVSAEGRLGILAMNFPNLGAKLKKPKPTQTTVIH